MGLGGGPARPRLLSRRWRSSACSPEDAGPAGPLGPPSLYATICCGQAWVRAAVVPAPTTLKEWGSSGGSAMVLNCGGRSPLPRAPPSRPSAHAVQDAQHLQIGGASGAGACEPGCAVGMPVRIGVAPTSSPIWADSSESGPRKPFSVSERRTTFWIGHVGLLRDGQDRFTALITARSVAARLGVDPDAPADPAAATRAST